MQLTDAAMQKPEEQHLQVINNTYVWSSIDMVIVTISNIQWRICQPMLNQKVMDGSVYSLPVASFGGHLS